MHRPGELLGEGFINEPVTVQKALPLENLSDDTNLEMRLAARARPGMSGMFVTLVDNLELAWRKRRLQLLCDSFPDLTQRHLLLLDLLIRP
jgi:hypothetical protein